MCVQIRITHIHICIPLVTQYKGSICLCSTHGLDFMLGSERSRGTGNENPLQHSYLENLPMGKGAWRATVGVAKESDMT